MEKLMEFFTKADSSPIRLPQSSVAQNKKEYLPDEADKAVKKVNSQPDSHRRTNKSPVTDFKKLNEELDSIEKQRKDFIETQLPVRRYQRLHNQYQSIKAELVNLTNKHEGLLKCIGELSPGPKATESPELNPKTSTVELTTKSDLHMAKDQLAKLIKENTELKSDLAALSEVSKRQEQKLRIYERISNFKIKPLGHNHFEFLMYSENQKWRLEMDIKIQGEKTTAVVTNSNSTSEELTIGSEFTFNSTDNYNFFVMLFIQLNNDLIKFK